MANVVIDDKHLYDIGDVLRSVYGETKQGFINEPSTEPFIWKSENATLNNSTIDFSSEGAPLPSTFSVEVYYPDAVELWLQVIGNHVYSIKIYDVSNGDKLLREYYNDATTGISETFTTTNHILVSVKLQSGFADLGYFASFNGYDADENRVPGGEWGTIDNTYKPREMAPVIQEMSKNALQPIVLTGDQTRGCSGSMSAMLINDYGHLISTKDITHAGQMFAYSTLSELPFEINMKKNTSAVLVYMFNYATILTAPIINNAKPASCDSMFGSCQLLRYIPEEMAATWDWSALNASTYDSCKNMFNGCCSLRAVPTNITSHIQNAASSSYSNSYYGLFSNCYSLDGVYSLGKSPATITSNVFYNSFQNCYRLMDMQFNLTWDNKPQTAPWSNQTIDLTTAGYGYTVGHITSYKGTVPKEAQVKKANDAATNNAIIAQYPNDWWTGDVEWSRYDHDSAVRTIATLPDVSAGTGNVIKFKGVAGSATAAGAINTLTEEEIAAATAKGWTVTLV